MREREIEAYLVQRVKELGGEVRKVKWIGRNGAPDRLIMLPDRKITHGCAACRYTRHDPRPCVWVELKATGKKAEPHQEREHTRMRVMGQRVEVIDSWEGVDKLLEQ